MSISIEVENIKRLPVYITQGYNGDIEWVEKAKVLQILATKVKAL
jgi:hypothetical protein